jgi:phosphatidylglycerophosphate synthase
MNHVHQHSVGRGAAAAATGLAIATGLAVAFTNALAQDPAYVWRVGFVYAAAMAIAVPGLRSWHPFPRLGPANLMTGLRMALVAGLAGVASGPRPETGWPLVVLATVAAIADAVDGPLARRSGLASRFGARFDMEVDALLILVLSLLAWRAAGVGAWILLAGALRYVFVATGTVFTWLSGVLPPRWRRQAVCVVQIAALILALVPGMPSQVAAGAAAGGLLLLTWSFAVDTAWLYAARKTSVAA